MQKRSGIYSQSVFVLSIIDIGRPVDFIELLFDEYGFVGWRIFHEYHSCTDHCAWAYNAARHDHCADACA